jgi:hypothetical protein
MRLSRVWGAGCGVQGVGFRVWGAGCGAQAVGRRVLGAGCGVQGVGCEQPRLCAPAQFTCGLSRILETVQSEK